MNRQRAVGAIVGAILLPGRISSATLPRIAVHLESDGTAAAQTVLKLTNAIAGKLIQSGKYEIVDRNRLADAIREQGFSNSAYADPKTAAALGKLSGASQILEITLSAEADEGAGAYIQSRSVHLTASFSLISVATGRVLSAGNGDGIGQSQSPAGSSMSVPQSQLERQAIDSCADDIVTQIAGSK